jgi:hypothetical protein
MSLGGCSSRTGASDSTTESTKANVGLMIKAMLPSIARLKTAIRPSLLTWSRFLQSSSSINNPAEPKPVAISKLKDSFNDATSVAYLEELEKRFNADPNSIDRTWASFFTSLGMFSYR